MTGNFRAFLVTHLFLVVVYAGLRLVALTPCSRMCGRMYRQSLALVSFLSALLAFWGPVLPLPWYVPSEPFCRDDDCGVVGVLMAMVWLDGVTAIFCVFAHFSEQSYPLVSGELLIVGFLLIMTISMPLKKIVPDISGVLLVLSLPAVPTMFVASAVGLVKWHGG